MQTRLKKKGFTLVELVIVVAVIAVLSAILIPTIGCFVEQAKETNDMATVRLLNAALIEDGAENAQPENMTEALDAMKRKGYLIDKLTPRSSGEILWDSVNNRFLLRNKEGKDIYADNSKAVSENYKLWKVIDNLSDINGEYSYYLKESYVFNGETIKVSAGLDVGDNTGISSITYDRSDATDKKSVIIRSNVGSVLTISAPYDTVDHYGWAKTLNIEAIDGEHCYNEYGSVGIATIKQGKFVTHRNCSIASIRIAEDATAVTVDVSEEVKEVVYKGSAAGVIVKGTTAATASKLYDAAVFTEKYKTTTPEGYAKNTGDKTIEISSVDALLYSGYIAKDAQSEEYTVEIKADIDFENIVLENGFNFAKATVKGNNHTIKNLYIENSVSEKDGKTALFTQVYKVEDLVLDNINVSIQSRTYDNDERAAILAAEILGNYGGANNVTIKNSSVRGGKFTGAFIGNGYANVTSSSLENCIVAGQSQCGAFAGYICTEITTGPRQFNNNVIKNSRVELLNQFEKTYLGKFIGTLNAGENTDSVTTLECKNNTIENNVFAAENDFGRLVNGSKVAY